MANEPNPPSSASRRLLTVLLTVVVVILSVQFLRQAYTIAMPLAAAVFLTMLVEPVQRHLAHRMSNRFRWVASLAALLVILAGLSLFAGAIVLATTLIAGRSDYYAALFMRHWNQATAWMAQHGMTVRSPNGEQIGQALLWVSRGVQSTTHVLALLVLVVFFVLLMLLELRRWRAKVDAAFEAGRAGKVLDTVAAAASQIRQFLVIRTAMGFISAAAHGIWLWIMGVDLVLVWALLFFFLNYIPTLGSVVAAVPPALVAIVTLSPGQAVLAVGGILVIEQVLGNFVDPMLIGRRLSLSPLVTMVAVVFWGWVWGPIGALLSVPLTATMVIAMAHSPRLRPVALLLSRSADEDELCQRTHRT